MSPASVFNLAELGRPIEATVPFLVNDTGTVWFLSSGSVDLFVVRTVDGEAFLARHSLEGVVWVSHTTGMSRFLASAAVEPLTPASTFFPVTRYGWLETEEKSELVAIDSSTLAGLDPELRALTSVFHCAVMQHLAWKRKA